MLPKHVTQWDSSIVRWARCNQQDVGVLQNPVILLCDEATSALDSRTEKQILQALQTLAHGRTSLFVAHRLSTAAQCDQIVVLEGVRIRIASQLCWHLKLLRSAWFHTHAFVNVLHKTVTVCLSMSDYITQSWLWMLWTWAKLLLHLQGRVVESGTHSSLLAKSGKYATMWSRQANVDDASSVELFEDNQHIKHEWADNTAFGCCF